MYENTLSKAGLSPDQACVYEVLLKNGALPAGDVSKKAQLKRGLTYKVLDELVLLGLAKKNDKEKVLRFEPAHPLQLKELAERKEQEARVAQEALGGVLSNLVSDFNLISGKPGVQYFEGKEAVRRITEDSLTAQGGICSFIDNEAVTTQLSDVNRLYVKKRIALGIKKRMITGDTEYIRSRGNDFDPVYTEVRVIPSSVAFGTVMQVYDATVSYLTIEKEKMVGVIIKDAHIASMHRAVFEHVWQTARPLGAANQPFSNQPDA
jgi:sugar-specific transcriptional regulator TrmB